VSQKCGFGDGKVRVIDSCRAPCSQSYYSYLISSVQQPLLSLPQRAPAHGPGVLSARCSVNPRNIVKLIALGRLVYHDDDKNNNEDEQCIDSVDIWKWLCDSGLETPTSIS